MQLAKNISIKKRGSRSGEMVAHTCYPRTGVLWIKPSVHCEYIPLSLANKELTG